jgi:hypothetical protein
LQKKKELGGDRNLEPTITNLQDNGTGDEESDEDDSNVGFGGRYDDDDESISYICC